MGFKSDVQRFRQDRTSVDRRIRLLAALVGRQHVRSTSGEHAESRADGRVKQGRDFIHVQDIVAGTKATPGRPPGRYNLGTGRGTSLNELATMVLSKLAPGQKPKYADAQAGELRFSVADIGAARKALGFSPARSLQKDLDDVIAYVREREVVR